METFPKLAPLFRHCRPAVGGGNPFQVRIGMKPFVSAEEEEEERKRTYCNRPISLSTMGREFGSVPFQIPPFRNPSPFPPMLPQYRARQGSAKLPITWD